MSDNVMQHILKGDNQLALLIHQFNVFPTRYIHPSWWEHIINFTPVFGQGADNRRAEKHLAAYILNILGNEYCYKFQDVAHRIVLLDRMTLEKLVFCLGLTVNAKQIKAIVEGRKARQLKKEFGENAYLFAIKRATLFGSHDWFRQETDDEAADLDREKIFYDGCKCIKICLRNAPDAMTARFELKFAKTVRWNFAEKGQKKDKDRAWSLVRKILFQEAGPQWKILFK
jgi:hypothetical protein